MPGIERVRQIVVIASSTGGPKSLQQVVPKFPKNLDAAVIIVQHMPPGFTGSLANRLNDLSQIHVKEAEDEELLETGTVYIAKGGRHLRVKDHNHRYSLALSDEPPREGVRPCANYTYESLVDTSLDSIVCAVMTGMGADGTEGIRNLKQKKKIYTVAQNEQTCIIYGMPKVVTESGLVDKVVPLEEIANEITKKVGVL